MSIYEELFSVAGKTALITGGAKGIGAMISRTLVQAGCRVFVTGRSRHAGERLVEELSRHGECTFLCHDLASEQAIGDLKQELAASAESLDILVNNAGTFNAEPLGGIRGDNWDALLSLNLRTPFLLIQALLPLLEAGATGDDPARIINIGSIGGLMPQSNGAYAYGCSKAAIHQMTRMLASDLRGRNINVNAIAPGYFPSDMTAGFFEAVPNLEETMRAKIPAHRFGSQEDIGGMVIFLTSRAGSYLTGSITALDGGLLTAP